MSILENRPHSALIVVDVQNGVVAGNYKRDEVVANIGELVDRPRDQNVPVVWIQDSCEPRTIGTDAWKIVPELAPTGTEPLIDNKYGDSFERTDLESVLSNLGVGRVFVAGAHTDACIRSTIHGGFVRGYDTILVS